MSAIPSRPKTLKAQVRFILQKCPTARKDNVRLMIEVWREFYNVHGIFVPIDRLYQLPLVHDVVRVRPDNQESEA